MKKKNEKFIIGGIIISAATLVFSLLALYRPYAAGEAVIANETESIPVLTSPDLSPTGSPTANTTEQVPDLVSTSELGNISDLSADFSSPNQDQTYSAMLDTALGPMLYYNQGDRRWGDYLYGSSDPMKQYGCGPTAIAMLVNGFSSGSATPVEIADWAADSGYYAPQGGSYHSIIPDGLSHYGLSVASVKDRSYDNAARLLRTGHILVALMGKGSLTQNGHFILITRILDNGNVQIADPNSYDNSTKEWDLEQLLSELKHSRDSGGPLWAVSGASG